jgi:two-component system chemotaxis response regulator CheB
MTAIRVLIADDSAVARKWVSQLLAEAPELVVVGTAPTGRMALEQVAELHPDVLLLDLAMPDMNGLEVLKQLRQRHPGLPVLMFSALTERAGNLTLDALALGASDYITKPSAREGPDGMARVREQLITKLKELHARAREKGAAPSSARVIEPPSPMPLEPLRVTAVVVGVSTGGPRMLPEVLSKLPANLPVPVLIVQHMPPMFTQLFADRLDADCLLHVREARSGEPVLPGHVWIAPGDHHLTLVRDRDTVKLWVHQGPMENSCRPSVDVLFRSAAKVYGPGVLAVVMTGMGQDGLLGSQCVSEAGGQILVQDPDTCVVTSMPRAVMQAGLQHRSVPLKALGAEIVRRVFRGLPPGAEAQPGTRPARED